MKNNSTKTSYNVNINLNLGDKNRSDEEILEIIAQDIEVKMGELFRTVGLINFMLEQGEITNELATGYIEVLTEIGYAMSSSREESVMEFRRNKKAEIKSEPTVLDLSSQVTAEDDCINLAKHISAVLKDPRTPVRLYNAMSDELSSLGMPQDIVDSPEYVASLLCNEETREAKNAQN